MDKHVQLLRDRLVEMGRERLAKHPSWRSSRTTSGPADSSRTWKLVPMRSFWHASPTAKCRRRRPGDCPTCCANVLAISSFLRWPASVTDYSEQCKPPNRCIACRKSASLSGRQPSGSETITLPTRALSGRASLRARRLSDGSWNSMVSVRRSPPWRQTFSSLVWECHSPTTLRLMSR